MTHLVDLYRRLSVYTEDRQHAAFTLLVVVYLLGLGTEGWIGAFSACGFAWVLLERLPAVDEPAGETGEDRDGASATNSLSAPPP